MGDQMAPGRPDSERSCCLLAKYQGLLNKCEQKQASFDDQIAPGDQIGRPDFHILVTSKIWSSIWSPGAIWSPIRSPEHLVVDLVVVDDFTLSKFDWPTQFWFNMGPFWDQPYDKVSGQSQGKTSTKNQMKDMGIFLSLIPHSFL